MFISYFEPYYFRNRPDIQIAFFYKQINDYKPDEMYFFSNQDFFNSVDTWKKRNCWNLSDFAQNFHNFHLPTDEELSCYGRSVIDESLFDNLLQQTNNDMTLSEKILLTEVYDQLRIFFEQELDRLSKKYDIEGILTLKNCPSLELAAKKYNIKVIHYETAGLRPLQYDFLMYFDFRGVNGNTSSKEEFELFKKEYKNSGIKLLSNKEILNLFKRNGFEPDNLCNELPVFEVGAALQIFNDSNLIAFSNGYDSEKVIDFALENFDKKDILIRNHPSSMEERLLSFQNVDKSENAATFISRCKKIITINSSVAFESALYDKPVYILGDSPYNILSEDINTISDSKYRVENSLLRQLKINYLTFVYMVPYDLMFDINYLRFRLNNPSLTDIYNLHLNYFKEKKYKLELECLKNKNMELQKKLADLNVQLNDPKTLIKNIHKLIHKMSCVVKIKQGEI